MYFRLSGLIISVIVLIASQIGYAAPALVIPASLGVLLFLVMFLRRSSGRPGRTFFGKRRRIIVDGSNVMYWKDGAPRLDSIRDVVAKLTALGYAPGVMFDANVGYELADRYLDNAAMSQLLNMPEGNVMVAPRGTPADQLILQASRDLGARIVSNDRFREWAETFPEVSVPGRVIRGRYQQGDVKLLTEA